MSNNISKFKIPVRIFLLPKSLEPSSDRRPKHPHDLSRFFWSGLNETNQICEKAFTEYKFYCLNTLKDKSHPFN